MKIKLIAIITTIALILSFSCITSNAFNNSNTLQTDENYVTDFFSDPKVTHIDGTPLDEEIVFSLQEIEDEVITSTFKEDNVKIYEVVFENGDGKVLIDEPLSYAVTIFDSILDFTGSDKLYEVYEIDEEHKMTPVDSKLNENYVKFNLENNYGFVIREITPITTTDSETDNIDSESSDINTDSEDSDMNTDSDNPNNNTDDEDFIIIDKDTDSSTDTSSDSTDLDTDDDTLLGDVDMNKKINMEDVVQLQKAVAKIVILNDKQVVNADVNIDDQCNMEDVTLIQKFIAQIISNFK